MMSARLKSHIRDWQDMASFDPFRAISGQKRDWHIEEFWATAQPHMDQLFLSVSLLGLPKSHDRALDFGCGAGRFLQHFKLRFAEVWGVDVSPSMIDLAREHNPDCKFHLITSANMEFFPRDHFDLIYSFLVLQHLPDQSLIERYLLEFIRILKPGGVAAFQIPDRLNIRWKMQPRRRLYHVLHSLGLSSQRLQTLNLLPMRLTALSADKVAKIVSMARGKICHKEQLSGQDGIMYYCTK